MGKQNHPFTPLNETLKQLSEKHLSEPSPPIFKVYKEKEKMSLLSPKLDYSTSFYRALL
ncbi:hypothetical protein MM221_13350 [Salipaludibacillus sp. LMS25]|uniref:hypothetical protein n=1 Tax=Salipaludibacillus sp. LMS25 TaxID=2924031 RepID=UPI0020D19690|nr:hypothetical protein [Salipaludibacillus sp. LMS25]UTR13605.1 hypothetical protein MM221_13350 [Salipaludibacillus sp. LMS25]